MSSEIELKLLTGKPENLDDIYAGALRHLYRSGDRTRSLRSVYYDTADLRLRGAGFSLRIREDDGAFVMTAKGPSGKQEDGVERGEWECRVPSAELDRRSIGTILPDTIVTALGDEALAPMFETIVERHEVTLTSASSTIEVAVDRGRIVAGDRQEPLAELELELKQGDPADLYELALDLTRYGVLLPSSRSKSERGFDLAAGRLPAAMKAPQLDVSGKRPLDDVLAAVFSGALSHLVANLHWVGDETMPEAVHQARVALRRLRSAFALLRRISWSEDEARLMTEAKWLAAELGPARDWDVLVTETIAHAVAAVPSVGGYETLSEAIAPRRRLAHEAARQAATDLRCSRFVLELGLWIRRKAWRRDATPEAIALLDRRAAAAAPDALARLHGKVERLGKDFDQLDPAARHALRIAIKKLRYACDFLLPVAARPKRARAYAAAVTDLQDHLGRANDATRTAEFLWQLEPDALPADANRAIGAVLAVQAMDVGREQETMSAQWRAFAKLDLPWKYG